jgi:hypothetical protein
VATGAAPTACSRSWRWTFLAIVCSSARSAAIPAQQRDLGACSGELGCTQVAQRPLETVVQTRHHGPGRHRLTALDGDFQHAAAELEADHAIVELDHTLQGRALGPRPAAARCQDEQRARSPGRARVIYHSYDNDLSRRTVKPPPGGNLVFFVGITR